jgi:ferredoxin-NADP reductase
MDEYQMILVDRHRIARDTMGFWSDTNGANFRFRAGQARRSYLRAPVHGGGGDNARTFSLASSPLDDRPVMIAVRMRETAFKTELKAAALGTKRIVIRPRGSFTQHRDITRSAVFLAGGIGIAPIRSILHGRSWNVCLTNCICSIQTGTRTTLRSLKNLKV